MNVAIVPPFSALALHGLAHLPLRGHASIFDAAYVAWAREALGAEAVAPLAEDAPRIAAEVDRADAGAALSWLPRLHHGIDAALGASSIDLAALDAARVDDPAALRALRGIDPVGVEWLRADLALAARAFERSHSEDLRALERACAELELVLAEAPAAARPSSVRVARALGRRGRAYEKEVWVGLPGERLDVRAVAVVALHEEAVRRARGDYASREWEALESVAVALDGTPLAPAHADWLASLDLGSVVDDPALALDTSLRTALHAHPRDRAEHLRSAERSARRAGPEAQRALRPRSARTER